MWGPFRILIHNLQLIGRKETDVFRVFFPPKITLQEIGNVSEELSISFSVLNSEKAFKSTRAH